MCDRVPDPHTDQDPGVFVSSHPERPSVTGSIGGPEPEAPMEEPQQERQYIGAGRPLQGDPWRHRSMSMRCATCMWFVLKTASGARVPTRPLGRCRRRAPTMNGYPVVFESDWCGDHKLDENKP